MVLKANITLVVVKQQLKYISMSYSTRLNGIHHTKMPIMNSSVGLFR